MRIHAFDFIAVMNSLFVKLFVFIIFLWMFPEPAIWAQPTPSLDETIQYITDKVNATPSSVIHFDGESPNAASQASYRIGGLGDGLLKVVITLTTTVKPPAPITGVLTDVTTIGIPLSQCSPDISCKMSSKTPNRSIVGLSISNGKNLIAGTHTTTPDGGESIHLPDVKTNTTIVCVFDNDSDLVQARSLANALRHAIELSGGKADPFAPSAASQ